MRGAGQVDRWRARLESVPRLQEFCRYSIEGGSVSCATEEINQHQSIEAVVDLPPGNHTLNVQVLKWQDAADSHIDVFADLNGYSTLLWHKVADL